MSERGDNRASAATPGTSSTAAPAAGTPGTGTTAPATPPPGATTFPFAAIVGQRDLCDALLVCAVAPEIGGVLVRGERGTAKSTAVRALREILPPVRCARGQRFAYAPGERSPDGPVPADAAVEHRPAPLAEVPLGASLDRLVGAVDLRRALAEGEVVFEPGLLARAHNGILYVDEVNLLPDHLVDVLLDAAATGVARVEREAVSIEHDARFVLVGTMNAEEGELRPQLADRFGLAVTVTTPRDPAIRAEIVRRRLAFDADPDAFRARYEPAQRELAERVARARELYPEVRLGEGLLATIVHVCAELAVDGARGDIVAARTARALAALAGRSEVVPEDVKRALELALAHRTRRDPLAGDIGSDGVSEVVSEAFARAEAEVQKAGSKAESIANPQPRVDGKSASGDIGSDSGSKIQPGPARGPSPASQTDLPRSTPDGSSVSPPDRTTAPESSGSRSSTGAGGAYAPHASAPREHVPRPEAALAPRALLAVAARSAAAHAAAASSGLAAGDREGAFAATGRRLRLRGAGGAIDAVPLAGASGERDGCELAVAATLLARRAGAPEPLRRTVRAGRSGALLCLVVDASGSMGARRRLARLKAALEELLRDAYAARDRVALVVFRNNRAVVAARPGAPLERAARVLRELPAGGRTPLAHGLRTAAQLIATERRREPARPVVCVLATDGRVPRLTVADRRAARALAQACDAIHLLDTEDGPVPIGRSGEIARLLGARLHRLHTGR